MACDDYTKIWDLAPGVTLEDDLRDVVLAAGDTFTIDRGGLTLVEAQGAATVCVLARHVTELRRRTDRPGLASRLVAWLASVGAADRDRRFAPYY